MPESLCEGRSWRKLAELGNFKKKRNKFTFIFLNQQLYRVLLKMPNATGGLVTVIIQAWVKKGEKMYDVQRFFHVIFSIKKNGQKRLMQKKTVLIQFYFPPPVCHCICSFLGQIRAAGK